MSPRAPTLTQAVEHTIAAALRDVHTVLPGEVQSYDAQKQTATVRPLINPGVRREDGTLDYESLPDLQNVPLLFFGSGSFRMTTPVKKGDSVLLLFIESRRDGWQASSGGQVPADSLRRFHLSDSVALPLGKAWSGYGSTEATLGKDGGPQIVFGDSVIELGTDEASSATEGALLASTYRQNEKQTNQTVGAALTAAAGFIATAAGAITAFATAVNALGGTGATPTPGAAIGALAAPLQPAGIALQNAQAQLSQAGQALTQFEAQASGRNDDVSQIVKLK